MKVAITGIGPMLENCKSVEALQNFDPVNTAQYGNSEWFDPKVDCGGRGFKYFNLATRYMVAAMRQLDAPVKPADAGPESIGRGVVIGSNSCTRRELDEFSSLTRAEGSDAINPMRAPSFCANIGTGNVGIKHQAKAFNITLVNPIVAGLESVLLAKHAILDSRANVAFAGAMEDESRFYISENCAVETVGGAWVLKLESLQHANPDNIIGTIDETLDSLLPAGRLDDVNLQKRLQSDLQKLISNDTSVPVFISAQNDPHSVVVIELLKQQLKTIGVDEANIHTPKSENKLGTILSLAQLSWCAIHETKALCLSVSPLGHVIAAKFTQEVGR